MEIGARRILHCNVVAHPTAEWTTQQFREVLAEAHPYRFVIHDRDSIFSRSLDAALKDFGVRAIKTPIQAPKANAYCERLVGTIRREWLDFLIPIHERHLRQLLTEFVMHYNRGRPHSVSVPEFPIQARPARQPAAIDISFTPVTESDRSRSWADYITNTAWRRRLSDGRGFCGPQRYEFRVR
jgi:transposase InsO family protein